VTPSDDLRQAEESLRLSEERFRQLVEGVEDYAICTLDEQGHVTTWNEGHRRITGYEAEEILGQQFRVFYTEEDVARRHPEEQLRTATTRGSVEEEGIRVRKDGSRFWASVLITALQDEGGNLRGFAKVTRDITERREAEDQIHFQAQLLQHIETAIIATDLQGSITHWNDYAGRLHGWTREEVLGRNIAELNIGPEETGVTEEILEQLQTGQSWAGEITLRRKDGSAFLCNGTISLIHDARRQVVGVVGIYKDITERKREENNLHQNVSRLLALREAGQVLSSTLESEEIVTRLLKIMQNVSDLTTAVINVHDEAGHLHIWRSVGLERLWQRARFVPEAETARLAAMESEERRLFRLRHPDFGRESLVGLCLPLKVKDRVIGVLEAYGLEMLAQNDTAEILDSLASQAASALENARLYEQLEERERKLQDLVEKLLRAQEEERRHVAYEVHDGLAQVAVASHQHLQAFASRYTPSEERGQRDLQRILKLVRGTVSDSRQIIANLRPTTLDDLGLAATISLEVERLREEGYQVHYEEELGYGRLPNVVEITIFRVIQESLTNMRKYAQTQQVHILLQRRKDHVYLKVQDFGRGFDPTAVSTGSGPAQNVGLAGMRERVSIVSGKLEIYSPPGVGTSVVATIPLMEAS
jgi:PAS domain S-box-containing protein